MSAFYTPPKKPSYSSPSHSTTSAYIAPSDTSYTSSLASGGYPALSYSFPIHPDLETTEHEHLVEETPVYLPELENLSYGDTLYGSEYKVIKHLENMFNICIFCRVPSLGSSPD